MSEILKPTPEQLVLILADHAKYLRGESDGKRADLRSADLRSADLRSADLRSADLRSADLYGADLRSANLSSADLRSANLYGANLSSANLSSADLRSANLYGADLRSANLSSADLRSADLRSANLYGADLKDLLNGALVLARTEILPREGEVVGWKKCYSGVIVKLKVPADAKRSNAPGGRKCRAERAEVLEVFGRDGSPVEVGISLYHSAVQYRKGATVAAHEWGTDRLIECAGGIHFYLTRDEAEVHV